MAIKIGDVAREERQGTAAEWAAANPIPRSGEWGYETDTGRVKIGDGVTAWNSLPYTHNIVETFDISAANKTMTLPKVSGYPQSYDFFWTGGDGTYTATLAVTNSETVGGITAATWTGEGEGSISCVSDGTNWEVKAYDDYVGTVGSWTNLEKLKNGLYKGYTSIFTQDLSETAFYTILDGISKNVGDIILCTGLAFTNSIRYSTSKIERTSSTEFDISVGNTATGSRGNISINSGGTGTWGDTNNLSLYLSLTETRWRT